MVQDDLREVDIGDGLEQHIELLDINASNRIQLEAREITVNLNTLHIGREQFFRLVIGAVVPRRLIAGDHHRRVGKGRHIVERRLLVEVQALNTVGRLDIIPHENIPEAPCIFPLEGVAIDSICQYAGMGCQRFGTREIASQTESIRLGVANLAKDTLVGLVPAIAPFVAPVSAVITFIVPIGIQLQFHHRELDSDIAAVEEMKRRLGNAAEQQRSHRHDNCRAGHRQDSIVAALHHLVISSLFLKLTPFLLILR